jgi:hypothetical protein
MTAFALESWPDDHPMPLWPTLMAAVATLGSVPSSASLRTICRPDIAAAALISATSVRPRLSFRAHVFKPPRVATALPFSRALARRRSAFGQRRSLGGGVASAHELGAGVIDLVVRPKGLQAGAGCRWLADVGEPLRVTVMPQ